MDGLEALERLRDALADRFMAKAIRHEATREMYHALMSTLTDALDAAASQAQPALPHEPTKATADFTFADRRCRHCGVCFPSDGRAVQPCPVRAPAAQPHDWGTLSEYSTNAAVRCKHCGAYYGSVGNRLCVPARQPAAERCEGFVCADEARDGGCFHAPEVHAQMRCARPGCGLRCDEHAAEGGKGGSDGDAATGNRDRGRGGDSPGVVDTAQATDVSAVVSAGPYRVEQTEADKHYNQASIIGPGINQKMGDKAAEGYVPRLNAAYAAGLAARPEAQPAEAPEPASALAAKDERIAVLERERNENRCEDCCCELSACGEMTADGPSMDCQPCLLKDALRKERDAHEATKRELLAAQQAALSEGVARGCAEARLRELEAEIEGRQDAYNDLLRRLEAAQRDVDAAALAAARAAGERDMRERAARKCGEIHGGAAAIRALRVEGEGSSNG